VTAYPEHDVEHLFTPATLATYLGVAEQTIYNRHNAGGDLPPVIKVGRLLRFDPTEVKAWLQSKSKARTCGPTETTNLALPRRRGRPTKAEQLARREATS